MKKFIFLLYFNIGSFLVFYMKTKVYSYSSSSSYSNLNGKESFESFETENDNGKIKSKHTVTKDGITTTKYFNNKKVLKNSKKNKTLQNA